LGVRFYTTLVALVESAILVLLLHVVQAREEPAVNQADHDTLVNVINRLYTGRRILRLRQLGRLLYRAARAGRNPRNAESLPSAPPQRR
jgi:hypothetical protein